jgi:hypothetical protein
MTGNVQKDLARIIGAVLTAVGIVGFFTEGMLIVFEINLLHNLVHLGTGVLGLLAGFSSIQYAQSYNKWLGVVYLLVAMLGILLPGLMENLLAINLADNILHFALGVVLAGVGFGVQQKQNITVRS